MSETINVGDLSKGEVKRVEGFIEFLKARKEGKEEKKKKARVLPLLPGV